MLIIHDEDTSSSYKKLTELIDSCKGHDTEVVIKDVSELDPTRLRQELSATNLFGTGKFLVIKNLLGGNKAKHKEILTKILSENQDAEVVLYESKKISDTALKIFSKSKVEHFSVNPVIFKFLDFLRPGNSKNVLTGWNRLLELDHEPEYIFAMVVRQFRLLIQAKSGPSYLKLAPYPKKMITSQANLYELTHLLDLYKQLFEIDKKVKTGSSPISIEQLLVHFFLQI